MQKKILLSVLTIFIVLCTYTAINIYSNDTVEEFIVARKLEVISRDKHILTKVERTQLYSLADKLSINTSSKNFIYGYISLTDGNIQSAKEHFQSSIDAIDLLTPHYIKLYSHKFLIDILIEEKDYSTALSYISDVSRLFNRKDYNESFNLVWEIFSSIRKIPEKMPLLNEYMISITQNNNLTDESKVFFYRKILGTYIINGDYLKGIEYIIKVLDICELNDMHYYKGKTLVDLSIVAKNLSDPIDAIEILNSIDSSKIDSKFKKADLEIYKLLNLSQNQIILANYDEALNDLNTINTYLDTLTSRKKNEVFIIQQLGKALIYIRQDKLEDAKVILEFIPRDFYLTDSYSYPNTYVDYLTVLGELYVKQEDYENARIIFEDIINFKFRGIELADYTNALKELITINSLLNDEVKLNDALAKQNEIDQFEKSLQFQMSYKYISESENIIEIKSKNKQISSLNILYLISLILIIIGIIKLHIIPMLLRRKAKKDFKRFMEIDNFFLVYQPIINPKTNKVIGLEALIRLNHSGKIIPPNFFLPKLCSVGMIGDLALWEIQKIKNSYMDILKLNLTDDPKNIYISINVSLQEIENISFINTLILESDPLLKEGATLCLEITENIGLAEKESIKEHISLLINAGFKIAIDDFGVDYSNISLLDHFDFHILKLDKHFIDNINDSVVVQSLMNVINDLSEKMDISIVVEGVEEDWQAELIKNYSSNSIYIQGYYYSKPLPIEELERLQLF